MFDVSPQTVYKWLRRNQEGGECALTNRTCRPHRVKRKYPPPTARTKKEFFSVNRPSIRRLQS